MYHEYLYVLENKVTKIVSIGTIYYKDKIDENNLNDEFRSMIQTLREKYDNVTDQDVIKTCLYNKEIDISTKICEEDEYLPKEEKCSICLKEEKLMLFVPCLHQTVCRNCCINLKDVADDFPFKCPLCRQEVTKVKQIHYPKISRKRKRKIEI